MVSKMLTILNIKDDYNEDNFDEFKVSVIIAHYNAGSKINKNLEQLSRQTINPDDFEVIVIDDKSPDGIDNLKIFSNKIKNFKILMETENNGYPSIPRNHGINYAKGKFVMIIDQDDYISTDALEKLVEFSNDESDIIIPKYAEGVDFKGTQAAFKKGNIFNASVYDNIISPLAPHKMFRRSFLNTNNLRFFSPDYVMVAEDQVFVMRAYAKAERISILADKSYYFWTKQEEHLGTSERYKINEPWKGVNILKEVLKAISDSDTLTVPEKEYATTTYLGRFIIRQGGGILKLADQMPNSLKRDIFLQNISFLVKKYVSPNMIFYVRERAIYLILGLYYGLSYTELKIGQDDIYNSVPQNVLLGSQGIYRKIEINEKIYQIPVNYLNQEKIRIVAFNFNEKGECLLSINVENDLLPNETFEAVLSIVQRNSNKKHNMAAVCNNLGINREFRFNIGSFKDENGPARYDLYILVKRNDYIKKYRIGKEKNENLLHLGKINNGRAFEFYITTGGYLAIEIK